MLDVKGMFGQPRERQNSDAKETVSAPLRVTVSPFSFSFSI
jgi:hypothetical protein